MGLSFRVWTLVERLFATSFNTLHPILALMGLGPLVVEGGRFAPVRVLSNVAGIAFAIPVVGQVGVEALLGQLLEVRFTMISGIGGDHGGLRPHRLHGLHHRNKQFLLLPHAVGLGVHDNWVLLVNNRHASVPLDHPLARSHLGRIVVGAV